MKTTWVEVLNFRKYNNARKDIKSTPWFRCQNDFVTNQQFFDLTNGQRLFWLLILGGCSSRMRPTTFISVAYAAGATKSSTDEIIEALRFFEGQGLIALSDKPPVDDDDDDDKIDDNSDGETVKPLVPKGSDNPLRIRNESVTDPSRVRNKPETNPDSGQHAPVPKPKKRRESSISLESAAPEKAAESELQYVVLDAETDENTAAEGAEPLQDKAVTHTLRTRNGSVTDTLRNVNGNVNDIELTNNPLLAPSRNSGGTQKPPSSRALSKLAKSAAVDVRLVVYGGRNESEARAELDPFAWRLVELTRGSWDRLHRGLVRAQSEGNETPANFDLRDSFVAKAAQAWMDTHGASLEANDARPD